jgi:hypothetical protein
MIYTWIFLIITFAITLYAYIWVSKNEYTIDTELKSHKEHKNVSRN